ncbi:hypothetical protein CAPTEDRAFT_217042 [Capitella teleta]|uniref:VWFA domain-containing protein n=1 Tax=Capitella teleta TaxID=283909 RepID=R7URE4_CAPTE|nr:hypothetical protein CAPTEDRAFT_217042 [Capitella teleta]|eukprot:ELU08765.1 hypothetical protein CAPTEDRAFT_217042 [Capitella teleta]
MEFLEAKFRVDERCLVINLVFSLDSSGRDNWFNVLDFTKEVVSTFQRQTAPDTGRHRQPTIRVLRAESSFNTLPVIKEPACYLTSECTNNADYAILLDSSGSLGVDHFEQLKDYLTLDHYL